VAPSGHKSRIQSAQQDFSHRSHQQTENGLSLSAFRARDLVVDLPEEWGGVIYKDVVLETLGEAGWKPFFSPMSSTSRLNMASLAVFSRNSAQIQQKLFLLMLSLPYLEAPFNDLSEYSSLVFSQVYSFSPALSHVSSSILVAELEHEHLLHHFSGLSLAEVLPVSEKLNKFFLHSWCIWTVMSGPLLREIPVFGSDLLGAAEQAGLDFLTFAPLTSRFVRASSAGSNIDQRSHYTELQVIVQQGHYFSIRYPPALSLLILPFFQEECILLRFHRSFSPPELRRPSYFLLFHLLLLRSQLFPLLWGWSSIPRAFTSNLFPPLRRRLQSRLSHGVQLASAPFFSCLKEMERINIEPPQRRASR